MHGPTVRKYSHDIQYKSLSLTINLLEYRDKKIQRSHVGRQEVRRLIADNQ